MPSSRTQQALARLADLTPRQIAAELDRYIVGQAEAKKAVAIALRNRWRRQRAPDSIREEISPNNIILIGPTGVGKTEIARRLAKLAGAPFIKVEASKFTEVGYVGRDVESMVRDLVESAIDMVRSERESEVEDLGHERVDERARSPSPLPTAQSTPGQPGRRLRRATVCMKSPKHRHAVADCRRRRRARCVPGVGQGTATKVVDVAQERYKRTRDKLRQLLLDGRLEDREVEVEVTPQSAPMFDVLASQGAPAGMDNFADMLKERVTKRKKKRSVKISEARRILFEQELDKLIDVEDVTADALDRVENLGIIFLDEIDKIAGERSQMGGPDVSREGVKRDLLVGRGLQRDEVRHGEDGPRAFIGRRVSRLEAERSDSGAARPLSDPGRAQAAHRKGFRADHDRTGERADEAVRRSRRSGRSEAGLHRERNRRDRPHRRDGERTDGEHRRPPPSHRDDDATRGRALRASRSREGGDAGGRQRRARAFEGDRGG